MATVTKQGDTVVIELSTLEKAEAVHGDIEIPGSAIASVDVVDDIIHEVHGMGLGGMKIAGAYLPGRIAMGTFRNGADNAPLFAAFHHDASRGVRVNLNDWTYSAILLSCEDPESVRTEVLGS